MPPTNILLGMSVPYFGTDGEKVSGDIVRDISIISYTTRRIRNQNTLLLYNNDPSNSLSKILWGPVFTKKTRGNDWRKYWD